RFSVEQCDLGTNNNDSEGTESCCGTNCKLHPLSWICRESDDSCIEPTACRTGEATCPTAILKGQGTPCVRDACIFNSSCKDGTCNGGKRLCEIDVRVIGSRGSVPQLKVLCAERDS